jgi:hypothetical protein
MYRLRCVRKGVRSRADILPGDIMVPVVVVLLVVDEVVPLSMH